MKIPVKVIERRGSKKILVKEFNGGSVIKVVKNNKKVIESLVGSISIMLNGNSKEGLEDLFRIINYMEDAKSVYIIVDKEDEGGE
ncbi:MAG TPA: hypothetical protein EYH22_02970 [Candidatus Nanopusillus sp.]|nr:hypothetical protein [Candidatus Nanopusillus sp.]